MFLRASSHPGIISTGFGIAGHNYQMLWKSFSDIIDNDKENGRNNIISGYNKREIKEYIKFFFVSLHLHK